MKQHSNAFYCGVKECRKTWWQTPEHLTAGDWDLLEKLRATNNLKDFCSVLERADREQRSAFFDRILGWPEGESYFWYGTEAARNFYYPRLNLEIRHTPDKVQEIIDRQSSVNKA